MAIAASYASTTSFLVPKDRTGSFQPGQRIRAYLGSAGMAEVTVVSSEYDAGNDITTVTITRGTLSPGLFRVAIGDTYSAEASGNIAEHPHDGPHSGGYMAASKFNDAKTDNLLTIPIPAVGQADRLLKVNPDYTLGYQLAQLLGTSNRVLVTLADGSITLNLPQDIHTGASPTFAGMILSGLTGIMEAKGASAIGIVASSGALQIFRRKSDNTGYEFAAINLADLSGDMNLSSIAAGDILYRDGSSKWVNLAKGSDDQFLSISSSTHLPVWVTMALAKISDWPSGVSATEVGYLDGVGSGIQGQIDGKEASSSLKLKWTIATLTDGADITPDWSTSLNFTVSLGGSRNFKNGSNLAVGQKGVIYIVQGSGGSHTLSWDTYYKFVGGAPTLSTTEGKVDAVWYDIRSATNIVCRFGADIGA